MSFYDFLKRGRPEIKLAVCAALLVVTTLVAGFVAVKHVYVIADGKKMEMMTTYTSPERILQSAGVALGAKDEYRLSTEKVENLTEITVYRAVPVKIEHEGNVKEILTGKPTVGELLNELGYDRVKYTSDPGADANIQKDIYISIYDTTKAADEAVRRAGNHYVETSRGVLRYTDKLIMEATAYLPTDGDGECITATGLVARHGIVAVDPDVIPLGTRLYIPGYGLAIAADTGGAIVGDIVDLCMESYDDCMEFGRRDVEVYILEG